jgi:thiol-disulfide isomerase/thioredoxin
MESLGQMEKLVGTTRRVLCMLGTLSFALSWGSCSTKNKPSESKAASPAETSVTSDISLSENTSAGKVEYLMAHYWDNFPFNDTTLISKPQVSEQAFADFVYLLNNLPAEMAEKGIVNLMDKAAICPEMLLYFSKLSEKYLYDPNSPMRNEPLFEYFLHAVIRSPVVDETHKIRPKILLKTVQKNKPGTKATDFDYTLPDGSTHKLSALPAEYVILYFHNPECRECAAVKEKLVSSPILNTLQQKGQLKILALYPDENLETYRKHLPEIPAEWINAYDKGTVIKNRELYDLKAIPTLYLLDKDKTVLLKDAPFETLEAYLAQKYQQ